MLKIDNIIFEAGFQDEMEAKVEEKKLDMKMMRALFGMK